MTSRHKTFLVSALALLIAGLVLCDAWLDHQLALKEQQSLVELRRIENARLALMIRAMMNGQYPVPDEM